MGEADLHRERLEVTVAALRSGADDWPEGQRDWFNSSLEAFTDMLERDQFPLTEKQAAWVEKVAEALELDLPEAPRAPVPRGKPVALLFVKGPLKPPGRK